MTQSNLRQSSGRTTPFFWLGWSVIGVVFGGLMLWSIFAPFQGAVFAQGSISVESNRQAIQHLEGGIVSELYVREGDRVGQGDALLRLEDTPIKAQLSSIEARLFEFIGQEARLAAERDGSSIATLDPAYANLKDRAELRRIIASQNELMVARAASKSTQIKLLNQNVSQLRERLQGLQNEIRAKETQSRLVDEEVEGLETLLSKGLSPKTRVLELKREQARLNGDREALVSQVATTRIQISDVEIEINQLTEGFRELVLTEMRDVQTQIAELTEQRVATLDRLSRLIITSPRAGRALGVQAHTIGGVIESGQPIMYIVPENDELIALIRIATHDIDKVIVGNEAVLLFPAFNLSATPEVKGIITKVSADALQDPATGAFYFEGVVEIPKGRLANQNFPLQPGMPVDARVLTEDRSVISYLLKPLGDAMSKTFRET